MLSKKKLPDYLCNLFNYVSNVQLYELRNNNQFRLPQNSLLFKGVQIYSRFKAQYTHIQ